MDYVSGAPSTVVCSEAVQQPTRASTVTFLFTDVEGSTKHWAADQAAMREALALHDELLHGAVATNGGRVFKHAGDGICAAFPNPTDALAAALDAQRSLANAPWPGERVLRVRMAVHSGEASEREEDYDGLSLARAARLMDVAHGGQVLVSPATAVLAQQGLPAACALTPLGTFQLRDGPGPEELFQLVHPELGSDFPPPRTTAVGHTNLRPSLTAFLGRAPDREALAGQLARSRLVTLIGPGGVGKTRLSQEIALAASSRFDDGVWMCELAPVSAHSDVVEALASSIALRAREGVDTAEAMMAWLRPRTALLVIDNCEHVIDQVRALVARVLQEAPSITLLLTSRESLGLPGERVWPTLPLGVPSGELHNPIEASRFEAVELFVERAQAVRPDFSLDAATTPLVCEICRRLDGMPLAVELAAARMRSMGPLELLGHLDQRFRILADRHREPRQSLRGAVDWSYELLDEDQRRLFRRLSAFAGSFTLEAATAVGAGHELDEWQLIDLLDELVSKSLVIAEQHGEHNRYRMLETLREYGTERLAETGEALDTARRHAEWALAFVRETAPGLHGPAERVCGDRIGEELGNLRAAHVWALANDADLAFELLAELADYTILRLDYEVAAWAERQHACTPSDSHPLRHVALGLVSHAAWARGDNDAALRLGLEAMATEARGALAPSWAARQAVCNSVWFRGWMAETKEYYQEWIARAREVGDDFHLAWGLSQWTVASAFLDRSPHNRALADEALALARRTDNPVLISFALYGACEWLIDDDPQQALRLVREGVESGRAASRSSFSYGLCLSTLASLVGRVGNSGEAVQHYLAAIENWQSAGNWSNQRILLRNVAEFASRQGEMELTASLLGALDASGEMNAADIGPEGERLARAIERAHQVLGTERYDAVVEQGGRRHPTAVVTDTVAVLRRLGERLAATDHASTALALPSGGADHPLSPREHEVACLIADGLSNRDIGARLYISERTVETHVTRIRTKLAMTSRTQIAVWGAAHRTQEAGAAHPLH